MSLKRIFFLLVLILLGKGLWAQSNTMYYLSGVPQAYYLNPASQPQPNFFIGCPVLGSFYFDVYHNSLDVSDLVWNETNAQGEQIVMHPFHPDADLGDFLDKFADANTLSGNMDMSLVSMGFRIRKMYFTLDVISKLNAGTSFSKDLINFGILGNEDNTVYNFSDLGFNFTQHAEIALGVSRKFGDMITVGIRPKLLFGVASISSRNNEISLATGHEVWDFDSHLEMQIATPGFIIPVDESGTFDPSGEFIFDSTLTSPSDYTSIATGNKGFGIDLGIQIKPMKELTLSASIIDLGYIKWNNYVHTVELNGSFEFTGYEYTSSGELSAEGDTSSFVDYMLDSLRSNFSVGGNADPFTTNLTPKIYIGASYSILPSLDLGLLTRFDLPESGITYDMMLHINWHPSTFFGLSANYSPFEGGSSTFGLGTSLRFGPFSFYGIADYNTFKFTVYKYETESDNYPVFISANDRSRFNFRFGINFVLGWNQRKKLMKDKPMYYSSDY